jgi:alkylhydroperoxidase/carboxymuconolactone decarboxylase family protein YurZ
VTWCVPDKFSAEAEVLRQVAVYAGVPAANAAFRTAKEIFREIYP